jgi:hypothetical protein
MKWVCESWDFDWWGMKWKRGWMNKGLTLRGWEEKVGIHEWKFAILWINSGKWYWERRKVRVKKDITFLLWYELIIGFFYVELIIGFDQILNETLNNFFSLFIMSRRSTPMLYLHYLNLSSLVYTFNLCWDTFDLK